MVFNPVNKITPVVILSMVLASTMLYAQAPAIVPVTPEAAALAKEVNYPVNLNTGVANISIPLVTVGHGDLTMPVVLNYHSGGFRINERSTSVGLGFSLSCDLQITRTVNGQDDLNPYRGYVANPDMKAHVPGSGADDYPLCDWSSPMSAALQCFRIFTGVEDGMPDKFNFKLLNKSGSFYFKKSLSASSYDIVTVPYDNTIDITFDANEDGTNARFTIIDSDGTTYYFENYREQQIAPLSGDAPYTAWKCNRIENYKKTEYFNFTYTDKSQVVTNGRSEKIVYVNDLDPCKLPAYYTADEISPWVEYYEDIDKSPLSSPQYTEYFAGSRAGLVHLPYLDENNNIIDATYPSESNSPYSHSSTTTALALSEITFRGGKLVFSGTDKLSSITVKDAQGAEVKSFVFEQTYKQPADLTAAKAVNGPDFEGTLYLNGIEVRKGGVLIEKYGLQYGEKFCFGNHLIGKDAWGQPNDYTQDFSVIAPPDIPISVPTQSITQRVVKSTYPCVAVDDVTLTIGNSNNTEQPSEKAMLGLLSRLVYPTGGYVDFQFEPNRYRLDNDLGYFVKQGGGVRIKSITYFDGQSNVARHQKYYRYGEFEEGLGLIINAPNKKFDWATYQYNAYSYNFLSTVISTYGAIKEVQTTTYEPASSLNYTYSTGAPIYYTKVTEYNSDFGLHTGKTVHTFYPPGQFMVPLDTRTKIDGTNVDVLHTDGLMGQPHFLKEYKYENGRYSLLRSKEFKYEKRSLPEQVKVVYVYNSSVVHNFIESPAYADCEVDENMHVTSCDFEERRRNYLRKECSAYMAGEYGLEVGRVLLTNEIETLIRDGHTLTKTTNYYYDDDYWQLSKTETTNSEGERITDTFKYAYDLPGTVYEQMVSGNMVSEPLEMTRYNNTRGKEVSTTKTNYDVITISPSQSFIAPVSVQKSFGGAALQYHLTYDRYDLHGNVLQVTAKDGVPASYLWGYNRLYPVAEVKGATYSDVENATSVDLENLLTTFGHGQITAGLDQVRALFPSALITSFTHQPLVGLLSRTDPAGVSTHFGYDGGNRLEAVKNNDEDIVTAYRYNMLNTATGYATYPWYLANVPHMETYSFACYHNSPTTYFPFNYHVEGGKYTGYIGSDPDFDAFQEMENAAPGYVPPDLDCPAASEKIQLYSRGVSQAHLDLLQDGSIVYSKSFPKNATNPDNYYTPKVFYVPAGDYQVNLRLEGNNYPGLVKFSLNDEVNDKDISAGETVTIAPGTVYSFTIYIEGQ